MGDLQRINIAIDGPAGAGKSSVARQLAGNLGYLYVDSGAMYRAVAWKLLQSGEDSRDKFVVDRCVASLQIDLLPHSEGQKVLVDDVDITAELRTPEINDAVSHVAQLDTVRHKLVQLQQSMALHKGVVMDGRDIGTCVIPQAELKVFLTADVEERAKRRCLQMYGADGCTPLKLKSLVNQIAERDRQDEQRTISPLVRAPDALLLDTTALSEQDVLQTLILWTQERVRGAQTS